MSAPSVTVPTLAVVDRGDGPPVVLVHGAGGSALTSFAAPAAALAVAFRVLAVDLPGREDEPAGGWTLDAVADALAATIRARSAEPVVLLGHSLGASVVARTALRHPDVVRDVVLVAAPWSHDGRVRLATRLWRHLHATDRTALAQHLVLTTSSPSWLASLDEADLQDLLQLAAELVPEATDVHLDLADQADLGADVRRLEKRVTTVLGDEDVLVRSAPWAAAATAGLVRLHTWTGGHDVLAHHPHELLALLTQLHDTPTTSRRTT